MSALGMSVTLAMIVKNEERVLARCLDSIQGAVDEIVIVDTGSTDATKDVALRYTDRIFDFQWCDDFAAARQFAFDQATSHWVFWLDADDIVRDAARLKPALAALPKDIGIVYWRYIYEHDQSGQPSWQSWRERCARVDAGPKWEGRIHETFTTRQQCGSVRMTDVVVEHFREHERSSEKLQRNLTLLQAELAASGDSPSARLLLHLGRDLASSGQMLKALPYIRRSIRLASNSEGSYYGHVYLAGLYNGLKRYEQAITTYLTALRYRPDWPDAYFGLAETYYYLKDWPKVEHWIRLGRLMTIPDNIAITNPLAYTYNWIIYHTNALYYLGNVQEAMEWTKRALEISPSDPFHQQNQVYFLQVLEREKQPVG
jgi:glycosyltransferase involved in cell wall biosynthesis